MIKMQTSTKKHSLKTRIIKQLNSSFILFYFNIQATSLSTRFCFYMFYKEVKHWSICYFMCAVSLHTPFLTFYLIEFMHLLEHLQFNFLHDNDLVILFQQLHVVKHHHASSVVSTQLHCHCNLEDEVIGKLFQLKCFVF